MTELEQAAAHRDLTEIREDGSLRVLLSNSSASYYILRGEEYGFEFELARQAATELGLHLQVVLPDPGMEPVEMLRSGRVDVIAMPLFPAQNLDQPIALTVPYDQVQLRLVVNAADEGRITRLEDLQGLQIAARRYSSGERELARLRQMGIDLTAVLYGADAPQEEILDLVADGTYPAAIALDSEVEAAQRFRPELRQGMALGPRHDIRWGVRADSHDLIVALNRALLHHIQRRGNGELVRSRFYNIIHARYFEDHGRRERHRSDPFLLARTGRISPYDDLFRAAAENSQLDWRLLAAVAFQESRFDPQANSWAGAVGVMQLRPRTAGVDAAELVDPEVNIPIGAKHLRALFDKYASVEGPDRLRLALAAYNCGEGHLDDARALSALRGEDPDVWEGSVRESLLLLRQPEYYQQVRYGYVRGQETVAYVRDIVRRFELLQHLTRNSVELAAARAVPEYTLD